MFCIAWLLGSDSQLAAGSEEGEILVYDLRSPQVLSYTPVPPIDREGGVSEGGTK